MAQRPQCVSNISFSMLSTRCVASPLVNLITMLRGFPFSIATSVKFTGFWPGLGFKSGWKRKFKIIFPPCSGLIRTLVIPVSLSFLILKYPVPISVQDPSFSLYALLLSDINVSSFSSPAPTISADSDTGAGESAGVSDITDAMEPSGFKFGS